jgi:hypothetical protein
MKRASVKLEVSVSVEVPDHIYERDKAQDGMSEEDVWHDYAVGEVSQHCEVLHGQDQDKDWVELWGEVLSCEIEEGPEDVEG